MRRSMPILCGFFVVVVACGKTETPAATDAGLDAGSGPGRIFAASTTISNQNGKILLALTTTSRVCAQITSNSFTLSPTAMINNAQGGNPCDPAATAETIFDAGPQTVTFGVYVGGNQTPDKSANVNVNVAGDVTATVNGTLLSN